MFFETLLFYNDGLSWPRGWLWRWLHAFTPTGATREAFSSPLVPRPPPWLSAFVFPHDKIPLAGEYQSKQYHVARICPFCHGKLARRCLARSSSHGSPPNLSYYVSERKGGKKKRKKEKQERFDECTAVTQRFPPYDKSRSRADNTATAICCTWRA